MTRSLDILHFDDWVYIITYDVLILFVYLMSVSIIYDLYLRTNCEKYYYDYNIVRYYGLYLVVAIA